MQPRRCLPFTPMFSSSLHSAAAPRVRGPVPRRSKPFALKYATSYRSRPSPPAQTVSPSSHRKRPATGADRARFHDDARRATSTGRATGCESWASLLLIPQARMGRAAELDATTIGGTKRPSKAYTGHRTVGESVIVGSATRCDRSVGTSESLRWPGRSFAVLSSRGTPGICREDVSLVSSTRLLGTGGTTRRHTAFDRLRRVRRAGARRWRTA